MKKVIKSIIALALLFFIFQLVVTFFETRHEIIYSISHEGKVYHIKEEFLKEDKNHYYNFEVTDENSRKYIFYYNKNYNKQNKILYDIESYQENNIHCILPVFKDKEVGSIICNQNGELLSSTYLKQAGLTFDNWYGSLKSKGYVFDDSGDDIVSQEHVTLYNHFPKDYKITLWSYRGLYILSENTVKKLDVLDNDYYENTLGTLVGNYYIVADTDQQFSYNRFYMINVLNETKDFVETDVEISKDSYFLGTIDDQIYILDRDKKLEYTFHTKTKKIKEIGSVSSNAKMYYNGKFESKDINIVSNNKEVFQMNKIVKELDDLYHPKEIKESGDKYFFVTNDNRVYYVMKDNLETKVLLFQDANLHDLKVIDDNLFFISGQDIIWYSVKSGYRRIVTHNELLYNNKNIFDVLKK